MNPLPTKHALLRDRRGWDGRATGLVFDADGLASLMPVPEPPAPVALPAPWAAAPSGAACLACHGALVADGAHGGVAWLDGSCDAAATVRAGLATPRGIAFVPGRGAFVADDGHGRVVVLRDPGLERVAEWPVGFADPGALAVDSAGRTVVASVSTGRLARLSAGGAPDAAWGVAMAAVAARFVAIADGDVLLVATTSGALRRFAPDGAPLVALPALDPALAAGAVAACAGRLFVADTATGAILALDAATGATLAALPRFTGPVTALACCADGSLLVKTGDDAGVLRCRPTAVAASGTIEAGPFDAGEGDAWFAADVEAQLRPNAAVGLALYASDDPATPPSPGDWIEAPASSLRVANLFPGTAARYAWVRATLRSDDARATPRLAQVRLSTPAEDYLDELPAIYRNADAPDAFLGRALAALRLQLDASERLIDGLPQRLSEDFAPAAELGWLAGWLGFDLPAGLDAAAQRALLGRIAALNARRGTPAGLADLVQACTGVRPRIVEAWRERRLWQLGTDSILGFDTGLAPATPAGMVVPEPTAAGCAPPAIGAAIVGQGGPLAADAFGTALFADAAHRFFVSVPAWQAPDDATRAAIRRVVEREKPAHTEVALCFVEAEMRVGLQATLGIDTLVAGAPAGASLHGMTLDLDARLGGADFAGHVSSQGRLGLDTRLA